MQNLEGAIENIYTKEEGFSREEDQHEQRLGGEKQHGVCGQPKQFKVAWGQNVRSLIMSGECLLYARPYSGSGFGHSKQSKPSLCPRDLTLQ